ncbi:homoserine dehydrogenase [soil metagenome]
MRDLPIILFGVGGVGRALVRQIIENREFHANQYNLGLNILAVCDRNSAVIELDNGIDDQDLQALLALKAAGGSLLDHALGANQSDLKGIIDIAGRAGAVVVDCTASDVTVPALLFSLTQGYKVVLANKKPLTVQQEVYDRLTRAGVTTLGQAGWRHLGQSRWETTCGAALPVIGTLNRLVASGDEVQRIAGTFSGTLGYVMTGLQAQRPFSEIVREAHQLGYTEPDPRDDLGGVDVARKALILARGLGWQLDLTDVQVTGLYPARMNELSIDEFMHALPDLDQQFQAQGQAAMAAGKVLRFAATVADGQCRVGPTLVEASSPLGRLSGTDNLVEFYTRWYNPNPLVVQGRGAGVDATASGVLADVIELAYTI